MEGGRGNNSGRGRGRGGGGRRGNYDDQQGGGRGRGNQGGGRGSEGSYHQPPARPQSQWVSRPPPQANQPPPQPAWGYRPPAQPVPVAVGATSGRGRGSTWTGRPWGESSRQPNPLPSPAPAPAPAPVPVGAAARVRSPTSSESGKQRQIEAIRRPDHGGTLAVRKINLVVNHFPISFDEAGTIYHYDVDVKPVAANGNPPAKKVLRKSDLRLIKDLAFPGAELLRTVYDGEKNVFSAIRLGEGQYRVDVPEGEDVRSGSYMFTIKLVNELKLSKLKDYLKGNLTHVPRDTLQGLDLVMKENPMRARIPMGSRSFFSARNSADLRGGLAAYKGFMPSLKPTEQGLSLCLDYSVLAFRKPMPVIDFLKDHVGFREVNEIVRMTKPIIDALRGLKVKVTHRRTNQKYTIVGLTRETTRNVSFEFVDTEGNAPPRMVNIVDYFRDKWGKDIRYLDIPCLDVGKPNKPNAIPMEFCVLAEGQRFPKENLDKNTAVYLKNLTLVKPWQRRDTICDMVRAEDGSFGEIARNFGISLDMNMTKVGGRVIGAPELKVGGTRPVRVDAEKCQWNLLGKTFVNPKSMDCWALLDFTDGDRYNRLQAEAFVNNLRGRSRNLGIQMAEPDVYRLTRMNDFSSVDRIERLLKDIVNEASRVNKGKQLQMIVCVMTRRDPGYKYIKWISETQIGVVTQCCLSPAANKGQDQYLANLCLKINAKLGGTNFEVSGKLTNFNPSDHVMFIGADVNHPAPMNKECPSIAAVVGTMNWPAANQYATRVSPQKHRCETIKNFGTMCLDLVKAYARINKVRPRRIVLFRDGVSEGQFEMVLGQELFDMKAAIYSDDYQPLITVIVAQKRHQTRLFVENKSDGGQTGNVPPGTVVDTKIVHPHDFDFYLCSHYGGIGTSKPTHYYVLFDENGFTSDRLQKLIYDMCFTFVRCTKPVSLVPPVYYADLVAYRGRMFQEVAMEKDPRGTSSTASFDQSFYDLHPELLNNMFFV
ncbi:protein argonaute 2-like [Salvia miltiorrhiza]|uniref:protein argonaute 2-like n=1 Tax=Salvia miltiorrhiza TaxID=226208 RepID=UPI0025AD9878|nr:protein argonaute 2-like [Salvia miltiorrhiza]